jgi:hypothetical protein
MAAVVIGAHRQRPAQLRKERSDAWTKARKAKFLTELALSCNVKRAAKHVGMWPASAYKRRAIDAEFADAWQAALQEGYVRLEEALLRRALAIVGHDAGVCDEGADSDGPVATDGCAVPAAPRDPLATMTVAQAIDILKHKRAHLAGLARVGRERRGNVARQRPTPEQTNAEIMRRIAIVRRQRAAIGITAFAETPDEASAAEEG